MGKRSAVVELFLGDMGSMQRELRPSTQREDQLTMETKLEQIAVKAANQLPKSVVREIRTPRSVGTGGGRPPPVTRWAAGNGRPDRDLDPYGLQISQKPAYFCNPTKINYFGRKAIWKTTLLRAGFLSTGGVLVELTVSMTEPKKARSEKESMTQHQGRHFLQIPGPSPVPDRVLRDEHGEPSLGRATHPRRTSQAWV